MAKSKKKYYGMKEQSGSFVIKTDAGYYVERNNNFELKEVYSDSVKDAQVFDLNLIAKWYMDNLRIPKEKEIEELTIEER